MAIDRCHPFAPGNGGFNGLVAKEAAMANGVGHIYLETHNWTETVAFWGALGFRLAEATDHGSGRLVPPDDGPYLYVAEVSPDRSPTMQVYLSVPAGEPLWPPPSVAASGEPTTTHWGTRTLTVTDPDGRAFVLEQPV